MTAGSNDANVHVSDEDGIFIGHKTNQYYPMLFENAVPVEPDRPPEDVRKRHVLACSTHPGMSNGGVSRCTTYHAKCWTSEPDRPTA